MRKKIMQNKKFLTGVIVGLIPFIIMIGGWRVTLIIVSIIAVCVIGETIAIASEVQAEKNSEALYQEIEQELKNFSPQAYSRIEPNNEILKENFYGKTLNALLNWEKLRFYGRVNPCTMKVQILVRNELGETIYEDSITCKEFKKNFIV